MADRLQELTVEALSQKSFDASDPTMVKEAQEKSEKAREDERRAIFNLMQTVEGRKFMWGSVCCVWDGNPVVPNDSFSTYYNLGMEWRARCLFKELLKISATLMVMMIRENAGEEFGGKDMASIQLADSFI